MYDMCVPLTKKFTANNDYTDIAADITNCNQYDTVNAVCTECAAAHVLKTNGTVCEAVDTDATLNCKVFDGTKCTTCWSDSYLYTKNDNSDSICCSNVAEVKDG